MSLELIATIICDNCGRRESSQPETHFTSGGAHATGHKYALEKAGWFTASRGRFYPQAHYCPDCADRPVKKIPGKPRWKGPEVTGAIESALQPPCLLPNDRVVWLHLTGEKRLRVGSPCKLISDNGISIQWHLRHSEKKARKEQIAGWIGNSELTAILGKPATG